MFRQEGNEVRVLSPDGQALTAIFVAPAEPGNRPRYAWVRLIEGPEAGDTVRVRYNAIKPSARAQVAG